MRRMFLSRCGASIIMQTAILSVLWVLRTSQTRCTIPVLRYHMLASPTFFHDHSCSRIVECDTQEQLIDLWLQSEQHWPESPAKDATARWTGPRRCNGRPRRRWRGREVVCARIEALERYCGVCWGPDRQRVRDRVRSTKWLFPEKGRASLAARGGSVSLGRRYPRAPWLGRLG